MLPYGKQAIDEDDIKAVVETLKSDFLTTGPKVAEFEKAFAEYIGSKYAVAVANGTAALHLACIVTGLKKDDELITSPVTFAASANCALYCGAKPVFVDIKQNGLIDENLIEQKITNRTQIIIPVHYAGLPCNMRKIKEIADKHKLIVVEDACHALGAEYSGTKIGNCDFSDMAVFSFHPVKHMTTGEGGMITTNSKEFYDKLLMLRHHGITKEAGKLENQDEGPWYHEMQLMGFNYRLTDFQCALGMSQLKKMDSFVNRRREIAAKYDAAFAGDSNLEIIRPNQDTRHAYHLYPILMKSEEERLKAFEFLKSKNIFAQVHYIPVYWHPHYRNLGYKKGMCPVAEEFYRREISIPMFPVMTDEDIEFVIKSIKEFIQ